MLNLYKLILGPILLTQVRRLKKRAIRLPEAQGPRQGQVGDGGAGPLRVLFVGDSSAAGVGVEHQREALALPAARILSSRLQVAVRWQLVAKSGVNTAEALQMLRAAALAPADILVTALGTNDVTSQQSLKRFAANYKLLIQEAVTRAGVGAAVVTGLPPMRILPAAPQPLRWYLGQYAKCLDTCLRRWCAEQENFSYLSLDWAAKPEEMAIDLYHPGPGQYQTWARLVSDHVTGLLAKGGIGKRF